MFEDTRVIQQVIQQPTQVHGLLHRLKVNPPTRGNYVPQHFPIDTSTKCTVCFLDCTGATDSSCSVCTRRVHADCRGTMGLATVVVLEQPTWTCPLCIPTERGGPRDMLPPCALCPRSLQMDIAMRLNAKRNARDHISQVWMHPLCILAATTLDLSEEQECAMCTGPTASSYLRVYCSFDGCRVVMHTSCVMREALRGNAAILPNKHVTNATPDADSYTGVISQPPYRPMEVLCPRHCGSAFAWPTVHDPHPGGDLEDGDFPNLTECARDGCDNLATLKDSTPCTGCDRRLCQECSLMAGTCRYCQASGAKAQSSMNTDP